MLIVFYAVILLIILGVTTILVGLHMQKRSKDRNGAPPDDIYPLW